MLMGGGGKTRKAGGKNPHSHGEKTKRMEILHTWRKTEAEAQQHLAKKQ